MGWGDPRGFPGRVEGTTWRSCTNREILGEVRDGSGTLWEVRDRSGDHLGSPGRIGGLS